MTKQYKLYLSGPSKNLEDEGKAWRQQASDYINEYWDSVDVYDPTAAYDYTFHPAKTNKECRKLFMHHLKSSDVVLVNLNETASSPGTAYEIGVAEELGIPIIGFGDTNVYNWTADSCDVIIDGGLKNAINYIMTYYFYYAK